MPSVIMVFVVASIALSACYALGLYGDGSLKSVVNQEYLTGNFIYSGEMILGQFNGNGTVEFENGEMLTGCFIDGRLNGEGVLYSNTELHDTWRFVGMFEDGIIKSGAFYLAGGEKIEYDPGDPAGALIGYRWQYDGFFNMNGQSGTGVFTFNDGYAYSGGFTNGLADGAGIYTGPSGSTVYAGGFKDGLFDGQGSYFCPEGWSYEGSFKNGLFDGEGLIMTGTATVRGLWAEGVQTERYE